MEFYYFVVEAFFCVAKMKAIKVEKENAVNIHINKKNDILPFLFLLEYWSHNILLKTRTIEGGIQTKQFKEY